MKGFLSVLLLVASIAILGAGPASAKAEPTRFEFGPDPVASTIVNPCTGEVVEMFGEIRGFGVMVQDGNFQFHFKTQTMTLLSGIGSEGNKYVSRQLLINEGVSPVQSFTTTSIAKFISQGSTDNFSVSLILHFSPNGEFTFHVGDTFCHG